MRWEYSPCGWLRQSLGDERFSGNLWHVRLNPDATNHLLKTSAVDLLQVRGVDTARLVRKLGRLPAGTMREVVQALAAVVEL